MQRGRVMTLLGTSLLGLGLLAAWGGQVAGPGSGHSSLTATACLDAGEQPEMIWVPPGRFTMGNDAGYPEERGAHAEQLDGFWMSRTEITNAQFAAFVTATGYRTLAERGIGNPLDPAATPIAGSAVFVAPPANQPFDPWMSWWQFRPGANWQQPEGPGSDLGGREQHPVVHVAWEDAQAYARWLGQRLPTEAEFEYAAQGESRFDAAAAHRANTWQGFFPFEDSGADGYTGSAPVGCFGANALGLHDLLGNVWEWTSSPFYPGHDFDRQQSYPQGFDPAQPEETAVAVIKGGSYLCAENYCMRYRPEARQGQSQGLGTSHIGFRTVLDAPARRGQ